MITGNTPTTVTHLSGVSFAIQIRSHQVIVDQTIKGGGEDSGPTPLDLLGASLGSCIAYYVHQFLETRAIPSGSIRVIVSHTRAPDPTRIDTFSVEVQLPAGVPERYMPMLERVLDSCPAHNTLTHGAKIGVSFTAPSEVMAIS